MGVALGSQEEGGIRSQPCKAKSVRPGRVRSLNPLGFVDPKRYMK